ncbi:glycosyl hydrolase family 61-domain-containing protein [Crepidotus variabilis]|uniref:lytic cellulose monooxygenase (C4-dehydrogenating) n=1 Tax=Crepidotus variabilis TaxID=179855 RepID=A0A9P6E3Z0_9AGAR|nr:glycosyl hydrolase family 61-domain-containing protein [Crepidotus variabilis]
MMTFSAIILPLLAAGSVSAHGLLSVATINGKQYQGPKIFGDNGPSPIRAVNSPDPNYGTSNTALTCGPGQTAGANVADANPGDQVSFDWRGADGSNWPHNTGPMLTYMASCGSTTCDKFDATQAKWFKINQVGRKDGQVEWQQQDLFNGGVDTVSIPKNIAPGNYLIRHEIIALHLATSKGKAEFYPACVQLNVGGSGTGKPTASELVSIPGAYSDDDPGIYDPDIYNTAAPYVFPGPPIAAFVDGGSSASSSGGSSAAGTKSASGSTATATRSGAIATPTAKPASVKGKVCKLQYTQQPLRAKRNKRSVSRIMRRWLESWIQ